MAFNVAGTCDTRGMDFHFLSSVSPTCRYHHRSAHWSLGNALQKKTQKDYKARERFQNGGNLPE
jgi:hypothetical protein